MSTRSFEDLYVESYVRLARSRTAIRPRTDLWQCRANPRPTEHAPDDLVHDAVQDSALWVLEGGSLEGLTQQFEPRLKKAIETTRAKFPQTKELWQLEARYSTAPGPGSEPEEDGSVRRRGPPPREWTVVRQAPLYEISRCGRIRRASHSTMPKEHTRKGYDPSPASEDVQPFLHQGALQVNLYVGGHGSNRRKRFQLKKLVLLSWREAPANLRGHVVCRDGDERNVHVDNLAWKAEVRRHGG